MFDQEVYQPNPAIKIIENTLAKSKNRRKRLHGFFQEFPREKGKLYETFVTLNDDLKDQFWGFFTEQLHKYKWDNFAEYMKKQRPGIHAVEIRAVTKQMTYFLKTWKRSNAKLLSGPSLEDLCADDVYPIQTHASYGLIYLEVTVDQTTVGYAPETNQIIEGKNIFAREDLSELPLQYAKKDEPSQTKMMSWYGTSHNHKAMVEQLLREQGVNLDPGHVEKIKLRKKRIELQNNYEFMQQVEKYFLTDRKELPSNIVQEKGRLLTV